MNKLKIGMLLKLPPEKGGIATTYIGLIEAIKGKVDLVTIGAPGSKADYQIKFNSFSLKKNLKKIIKKEKPDLLHMHHIAPYYGKYTFNLNFLSALALKIPKVVTLHEVHFPLKEKFPRNIKKAIVEKIEEKIVSKAAKIIVHTPKQKEFIKKKYKTDKVECIYYGLDPINQYKRKDKNLLFFGILSKGKGVEYLVRAMNSLPDYHLNIVGAVNTRSTKKYLNNIKKEVKKNKQKNIKLISKRWFNKKEKDLYFRKADIVVLPYIWAPYQSAVVTDAGAYGIPIVVTKVGSFWEMVDKFKFGEIVKPRNSKALAEGIRKVFKEYEKYKKGITKYRKAANWIEVAKRHLDLYKKVKKNA